MTADFGVMKRLIAVVAIQGHPEGVFVEDSVSDLAAEIYLWSRKVKQQGLLPEVYYWAILEPDDHFKE